MATWPSRGQQAPAYWDAQLKAYIDEGDATGAILLSSAADANTLLTEEAYLLPSASPGTVALNFPIDGFVGFLRNSNEWVDIRHQEAVAVTPAANRGRKWVRAFPGGSGVWGPWLEVAYKGQTAAADINYAGGTNLPAGTVEAALDTLAGRAVALTVAPSTDANTLLAHGSHFVYSTALATVALNYPVDSFRGHIRVSGTGDGLELVQEAFHINGPTWYRIRNGSTWSPWRGASNAGVWVGTTDLNTVVNAGVYASAGTAPNAPSGLASLITVTTEGNSVLQRADTNSNHRSFVRGSVDKGVTWQAWREVAYKGQTAAADINYAGGTNLPASTVEAALDTLDARAPITPALIAEGANLDTLTAPGVYYRSGTASNTTALNYPVDLFHGFLEVIKYSSALLQRFTYVSTGAVAPGGHRVWERTYFGGAWTAWRGVSYSGDAGGTIVGTGSPNGVVAAPIGSVFRNTESGGYNGAKVWRKDTGTGNTGWVVEDGDTGWRDVSSLLTADWALADTAGMLRLRRTNNTIEIVARLKRVTASGNKALPATILNLPVGLRPMVDYVPRGTATVGGSLAALGNVATGTELSVTSVAGGGTWAAGDTLSGGVVFTARPADAWPTTLPGTAV